jgi:formate dehydrogenase major subunit
MKLRHTIADRVAGLVRDWSFPRQFAGEDPTREAAQSTMSRRLRPRLEEADTPIGTEGRAGSGALRAGGITGQEPAL